MHRDLSPGNIIIIHGEAKILDLEFAKARKISDLQELTKQPDGSVPPRMALVRYDPRSEFFYAHFQS